MNKERRKALAEIVAELQALPDLSEIKDRLETLKDEEQEAFDNMSEGLQQSDRGQQMEAAVSAMEEAIELIDAFNIEEIVGHIETASE